MKWEDLGIGWIREGRPRRGGDANKSEMKGTPGEVKRVHLYLGYPGFIQDNSRHYILYSQL